MSRAPLIFTSSSRTAQGSYGAVPTHDSHTNEDGAIDSDDSFDQVRRRNTRESKGSDSDTSSDSPRKGPKGSVTASGRPAKRQAGDGVIALAREDSTDDDDDPPDNSRYSQVRASVSAIDDVAASIGTPRMWILSLLCALLGSGSNLFFSLRYPSVTITPVIALVVVHPLGLAWDRLLKRDDDPADVFDCGILVKGPVGRQSPAGVPRTTRLRRWLAQGRWNEKEHACVYISSNVSFGFAFATDVGGHPTNLRRERQSSGSSVRSPVHSLLTSTRSSSSRLSSTDKISAYYIRYSSPSLHRSWVTALQVLHADIL